MAGFLFVHGSWHGAWCWERLLPLLETRGHRVVAIDLPAHGVDTTSPYRVSLGRYAQAVCDAARGLSEPPILVGHSMGGMAITQAASFDPSCCAALVYLCAFIPESGDSLIGLGLRDRRSQLLRSVRLGLAGLRVRPDRARSLFYDTCDEADADWATRQLRLDPWRPLFDRYRESHPVSLPRCYIECTEDRAVSLERQRFMAGRRPMQRVATLETDHSPFLSAPEVLAGTLDGMAELAR